MTNIPYVRHHTLYKNVHIRTFKFHSCFLQRTVINWHSPELNSSHISVCENPSPEFYRNWLNKFGDITCGLHTMRLLYAHAHSLVHKHTQGSSVHKKVGIRDISSLATRKCITHYQANIKTKSLNKHLF
jgi:hypothetical protein